MTTDYQAKFFAHALTREGGKGVERLQQSLLNAAVDLNPHQVEAALFALRSPVSQGVLLADEVGLGKTIEAGLVMCQLWAERKRKILIVCPASLRKQWQCELEDKFNLPSVIVDAKSARQLQKEGFANPYTKCAVLISSYPFAAKNAENLRKVQWDVVVMDEAHKLRNSYRESNKVGQALRFALEGRRKLLLTATPLQNSLTELYGIATLLDDTYFGDLPSFRSRYVNVGGDIGELRNRIKEFTWRTLRKDVLAFVKYTNRLPLTESFACSDRENALYEDVSKYLQDETTYAFPARQRHMLTLIVRKVLASSTWALIGTLEHILNRLLNFQKDNELSDDELLSDIFRDDPDLIDEIEEDAEEDGDSEYFNAREQTSRETLSIDTEKLKEEIELVRDFISRARSIGTDTKTRHLLTALKTGWDKLKTLGAAEKAVVFTESRRSMNFLREFLEANGYAGEVVCFSGGGKKDETVNRIYEEYKAAHPEDDSSKPVMMRHALIDAFKNKAKILIATEAGAEGINLQFCSMVVNYDLPWNPQRVEQRIGRCHRYGQKFDVVVVNFCNTRNAADVRVYELLSQKFQLFEGLFGASNDVLGIVDKDGKSFERQIHDILQKCRSENEIKAAFDQLQEELQKEIAVRIAETKQRILDNLDDDVRKLLKIDLGEAKNLLSDSEKRFVLMTRHILGERAKFDDENPSVFTLDDPPLNTVMRGVYTLDRLRENDCSFVYRPNSDLGEWVIGSAKKLDTPFTEVVFDISNYNGKISTIEKLKGESGYLLVDKMTVNSFDEEGYLLFTGFLENGSIVPSEDLERMFSLRQYVLPAGELKAEVKTKLMENAQLLAHSSLQKSMEENNALFKERLEQLDRWVDDQVSVAEYALSAVKNELRSARHEQDIASNQEELAAATAKVEALERKKRRARQKIDEVEEKAVEDRRKILEILKKKMVQSVTNETLFIIKWKVI